MWPEPSQGSSWEQTTVINHCHGNDSMLSPVSLLAKHPTWDCLEDPRFPGGWGGGLNTERPVTMVVAVGQVRSDADGGRDGEELTDLRYSLKLESKHLPIE